MEFFNSLNLKQIKGGTKLKQGDLGSVLSYSLTDENGQEITSFDNKTAYINLVLDDKIWFTTTTIVDISRVTFRIDKAIPIGLYYLEIKIDDYIFPSDRDSIILIEEGSTPYDLKELVPNYDINMTIKGILSDLSQKGIDISDLNRRIGNVNAQLAEKVNKDEVTNVMTPKGTLAYASLPTSGNQVGWYYYCPDGDGVHGAGNYVWNGTSWFFGGTGDEGYNLLKGDLSNFQTGIGFNDNVVTARMLDDDSIINDYSARYIHSKSTEPDRVPMRQIAFQITGGGNTNIESVEVSGIFEPLTTNINVISIVHRDSGVDGTSLAETNIDGIRKFTLSATNLSLNNAPIAFFFRVGNTNQTPYNTIWEYIIKDLKFKVNGVEHDWTFHGITGYNDGTYELEDKKIYHKAYATKEYVNEITSKSITKNYLPLGTKLTNPNIILSLGESGLFDDGNVESPSVWWDENKLKWGMVYTGYKSDGSGSYLYSSIGLAWSDDLVNWEKDPNSPILEKSGIAGSADYGSVTGPVMYIEDGKYYLFYIGCSLSGYEQGWKRLCLATGTDIYHLSRITSTVVIDIEEGISSSPRHTAVYHANITKIGDKYYMYVNCKGKHPSVDRDCENILLFTSTNLFNWNYERVVVSCGTSTDAPDYQICGDPFVYDIGDNNYYMAYFESGEGYSYPRNTLAKTKKSEFPYGWEKTNINPTPVNYAKPFIIYSGGKMYYFTCHNRQIVLFKSE